MTICAEYVTFTSFWLLLQWFPYSYACIKFFSCCSSTTASTELRNGSIPGLFPILYELGSTMKANRRDQPLWSSPKLVTTVRTIPRSSAGLRHDAHVVGWFSFRSIAKEGVDLNEELPDGSYSSCPEVKHFKIASTAKRVIIRIWSLYFIRLAAVYWMRPHAPLRIWALCWVARHVVWLVTASCFFWSSGKVELLSVNPLSGLTTCQVCMVWLCGVAMETIRSPSVAHTLELCVRFDTTLHENLKFISSSLSGIWLFRYSELSVHICTWWYFTQSAHRCHFQHCGTTARRLFVCRWWARQRLIGNAEP